MKEDKQILWRVRKGISATGMALLCATALWNCIRFALLVQSATLLLTFVMVNALFAAFAVFVYNCGASVLWILEGVGSIVLYSCSNYPGFMANPVYMVWIVISFLCAMGGIAVEIKGRAVPARLAWKSLSIFLAVALGITILCAVPFLRTRGKTGDAEKEIWAVPAKYDSIPCPEAGTVEVLEYETRAYATDNRPVTKRAYVYLPYGYTAENQYDILYLMHGTGDGEGYWLVTQSENKTMLDNMIYYGDIRPVIVVTPTWYTEEDCIESPDVLTYTFAEELRNDLVVAVESKYSTYAEDVSEEGLMQSRDHRAFAGLSRGSTTTWHSAINKNFDLFSCFGCFSGCQTTEEEFAQGLQSDGYAELPIRYLYNTSGSFDFLLEEHVASYETLMEGEHRLTEGVNCSFDIFPMRYHSAESWHIALYNFLQLAF